MVSVMNKDETIILYGIEKNITEMIIHSKVGPHSVYQKRIVEAKQGG